jgi:chromosome segregation ATPase
MFGYPIHLPQNTFYQELGLDPEATKEEVTDAISNRKQELREQMVGIGKKLNDIYAAVPGLKETETEIATLRLENKDDRPAEKEGKLRVARNRLDELERKAISFNPEFKHLHSQMQILKQKEEDLNISPFSTPEKRLEYDQQNPPLELFKLSNCQRNDLFDRSRNNICLTILRRELSAYLAKQQEEIFHPNDLTRVDFSGDYSHTPLLDGDNQ